MRLFRGVLVAALLGSVAAHEVDARAAVMSINQTAFGPGSTLVTFDGLANGIEVNGLSVGGLTFATTLNGVATNGLAVIDGGPGVTNNVNPPNIVSFSDIGEALVVTLPGLSSQFGYGYAILATMPVPGATAIQLFNGPTSVGSLSYDGVPDPVFTGGFAGISSTLPFNRAILTFSSVGAAYAVDNIRVSGVVPEPSSLALASMSILCGLASLACHLLRNRTAS
jgi:hypothetical protein